MAQVHEWEARYKETETDRKSRMVQIRKLTRLLEESELDRKARMTQINKLTGLLKESEKDREARMDQINELTRLLRACETNRAENLGIIEILETKASRLKERMVSEERKALELEKDLSNLERTRIVRAARGIGIIKVKRLDSTIVRTKSENKNNSEKER
jgi:chromosome segregation ATPase